MKKCLKKLGKVLAITSILAISMQSMVVHAATANVTASAVVDSGSLAITTDSSETYYSGQIGSCSSSAAGVSITSQYICATLGTLVATDERGTGQGWTVTLKTTHLTTNGSVWKCDSGGCNTTSDIVQTGYYNGLFGTLVPNRAFRFVITQGGSPTGSGSGAKYTLTDATGTTIVSDAYMPAPSGGYSVLYQQCTGSPNCMVLKTSSSTSFSTSYFYTHWTDMIPTFDSASGSTTTIDTEFHVEPNTPAATSGSITGVTRGSSTSNLASTTVNAYESDQYTLMTASAGYGMGLYSQTVNLQALVPPNKRTGGYGSFITLTLT